MAQALRFFVGPPRSSTFLCCACVDQAEKGVVQMFGKFSSVKDPGCSMILWPIAELTPVSTRVLQINVQTETKTRDNVTISVVTAIQFSVGDTHKDVEDFFTKISNPKQVIEGYVDDTLRSRIPQLSLDEAFFKTQDLVESVRETINKGIKPYGIIVHNVLLTHLSPNDEILRSMNSVNVAKREREAAMEKAHADKILQVKAAEAEAEAKHLNGQGLARMRSAITDGFRGSIDSMRADGLQPREVVQMMLVTQYLDVMKDVHFFFSFFRLGSGTVDARHPVLRRHERCAFFSFFFFFFCLGSGTDDARHRVLRRHKKTCIFSFFLFCLGSGTDDPKP
eukprot:Tamp_20650.p1 GENE.Tamp_20650~~Tamp_20650.p1  ORF type:complete len:361 (-),score=51.95 Tamp_20650:104-1114(-)